MNHFYKIYFVYASTKNKVDLGIIFEKNKSEGYGWRRAMQLVPNDNNGLFPLGSIEFERIK